MATERDSERDLEKLAVKPDQYFYQESSLVRY